MLIGSVFYALYRRLIPTWQGIAGIIFLFACYDPAAIYHVRSPPPLHLGADRFRRTDLLTYQEWTRPFRFVADISYSLYLIHPLIGYVTMRLLIYAGLPYVAAFAVAPHW
jgi:hypothetical protein